MKKIITAIACLYFINMQSQLPTVQQFKQQNVANWQLALSTLRTDSRYATDLEVLYSKVAPFAGLYTYNEPYNNASSASHFMQALSELHRASDQLKFESAETLENRLKTFNNQQQTARTQPNFSNTVKIDVINTTISYLNYNEEFPNDGGLQLINGVYIPANNLPAFIQKQVTIVSPLEELILSVNNNVTYQFNATEMYQWGKKNCNNDRRFWKWSVTHHNAK